MVRPTKFWCRRIPKAYSSGNYSSTLWYLFVLIYLVLGDWVEQFICCSHSKLPEFFPCHPTLSRSHSFPTYPTGSWWPTDFNPWICQRPEPLVLWPNICQRRHLIDPNHLKWNILYQACCRRYTDDGGSCAHGVWRYMQRSRGCARNMGQNLVSQRILILEFPWPQRS